MDSRPPLLFVYGLASARVLHAIEKKQLHSAGRFFVERRGRHTRYVCAGETVDSISLQSSFRETVQPLLRDARFRLAGASYVLNLQRVRMVSGQTAHLTGGVCRFPNARDTGSAHSPSPPSARSTTRSTSSNQPSAGL